MPNNIPRYFEMHKPFLEVLKDGECHELKEIKKYVAELFELTEEDMAVLLPSGRQKVFASRISWAGTYLKKAGLISSSRRAVFSITAEGKRVLQENPEVIDNTYLLRYESFREFWRGSVSQTEVSDEIAEEGTETPDDIFEGAFQKIRENLADEVLNEVMKLSPVMFEKMVLDLLLKMGYGAFENAGQLTPATGDEGIDGIIMEDKLGFDLIYIQAKQWDPSRTVGRPELHTFAGALAGKGGKGLFVTTTKFSAPAKEYAGQQHIVLIDGKKLAELMIEYNFGVSIKKVFEVKTLDTDVFNEYLE
ncbi:restriction endonuclease [Ruminococcus gauvreauii]|uniref:Restriction endonuclease n=1 Tax=Ruminococcus gauvreauii TaxID=438033 RepID=A0ABY5VK81_9FIRM|nr:restriction endonuclease [Ruminococcus gauvreauii]UWP60747.1 restriction endonuclease [Ruminococcus gauvreauii]